MLLFDLIGNMVSGAVDAVEDAVDFTTNFVDDTLNCGVFTAIDFAVTNHESKQNEKLFNKEIDEMVKEARMKGSDWGDDDDDEDED